MIAMTVDALLLPRRPTDMRLTLRLLPGHGLPLAPRRPELLATTTTALLLLGTLFLDTLPEPCLDLCRSDYPPADARGRAASPARYDYPPRAGSVEAARYRFVFPRHLASFRLTDLLVAAALRVLLPVRPLVLLTTLRAITLALVAPPTTAAVLAATRTATPTVLLRPPGALAAAGSMLLPAVATPNRPGATGALESAANVVPRARTHTASRPTEEQQSTSSYIEMLSCMLVV